MFFWFGVCLNNTLVLFKHTPNWILLKNCSNQRKCILRGLRPLHGRKKSACGSREDLNKAIITIITIITIIGIIAIITTITIITTIITRGYAPKGGFAPRRGAKPRDSAALHARRAATAAGKN